MYGTVYFIRIGWFDMFATRRKRELQNEKLLLTAGFESTSSRLLEWRSYVLRFKERNREINPSVHRRILAKMYNVGFIRTACALRYQFP